MNYSGIVILALAIHSIINHSVLGNVHMKKDVPAGKHYRGLVLSMLAFFTVDSFWGLLYNAHAVALVFVDTMLYYALIAGIVFHWTRFVILYLDGPNRYTAALRYGGWLFTFLVAAGLVLNLFTRIMFRVDEAGVYHPGIIRYIILTLQVALFLFMSAVGLQVQFRKDSIKKRHHLALGISGIIMASMIILQICYPLKPFYTMGCLLGSCILHTFVVDDMKEDRRIELEEMIRREEQKDLELGTAKFLAYQDQLTGVKNTHAYTEAEEQIDRQIAGGELKEFGVIVFDMNNLKKTNDSKGHEAGDNLIRAASRAICSQFKRSPVYRIGGDEFVAILKDEDYQNRQALLDDFDRGIEANIPEGKAVVATGLAVFRPGEDSSYRHVFERADQRMYVRKKALKAMEASLPAV